MRLEAAANFVRDLGLTFGLPWSWFTAEDLALALPVVGLAWVACACGFGIGNVGV